MLTHILHHHDADAGTTLVIPTQILPTTNSLSFPPLRNHILRPHFNTFHNSYTLSRPTIHRHHLHASSSAPSLSSSHTSSQVLLAAPATFPGRGTRSLVLALAGAGAGAGALIIARQTSRGKEVEDAEKAAAGEQGHRKVPPVAQEYATRYQAMLRACRTVSVAIFIGVDYLVTPKFHQWLFKIKQRMPQTFLDSIQDPHPPPSAAAAAAAASTHVYQKIHQRSARKLLRVCQKNGGVYVKMGQHLSQLDYLLPQVVCKELTPLLDSNPTRDFEIVQNMLINELAHVQQIHIITQNDDHHQQKVRKDGLELQSSQHELSFALKHQYPHPHPSTHTSLSPLYQVFQSVDPVPIASASLAQVHVAYLHPEWLENNVPKQVLEQLKQRDDPTKVVIKVQHPGLLEASKGDVWVISAMIRLAARVFPDYNYTWLAEEMEKNLSKELNFVQEAANLNRCKHLFQTISPHLPVTTPHVIDPLTTKRILTMSYEDGVSVTDVEQFKAWGLAPHNVAKLVSETFNEQIFQHGFVHSDPHPGNILVRPKRHPTKHQNHQSNQPELVLLDHGLYTCLGHDLRFSYASLWQGIIQRDQEKIKASCRDMGVEDLTPLFASVLSLRPWHMMFHSDDTPRSSTPPATGATTMSLNHVSQLDPDQLRHYAQTYATEINRLFSRVPREILLVLKMNDNLRSLDRALGMPFNHFTVSAIHSMRFLDRENDKSIMEMDGSERSRAKDASAYVAYGAWMQRKLNVVKTRAVVEIKVGLLRLWAWMSTWTRRE